MIVAIGLALVLRLHDRVVRLKRSTRYTFVFSPLCMRRHLSGDVAAVFLDPVPVVLAVHLVTDGVEARPRLLRAGHLRRVQPVAVGPEKLDTGELRISFNSIALTINACMDRV